MKTLAPTLARLAAVALLAGACAKATSAGPGDPRRDLAQAQSSVCGACAQPTPVCDTTTAQCVACLVDADCGEGPRCIAETCVSGCSANSDCDGGRCDRDAGLCAPGCATDADCADPNDPVCDAATGQCVACLPSDDKCAAGSYCDASGAVPTCKGGCKDDTVCGGLHCCAHACHDTSSDAMNCGACGVACPSSSACCGGHCVDTRGDVANCGACGNACPCPGCTPICTAGRCAVGSCQGSNADCNMNPADGCEADLSSDSSNCGSCGNSCVVACLSGSCFPF